MPLSKQLKSEMTGIPADSSQINESEKQNVEPISKVDFAEATKPTTPELEIDADVQPKVSAFNTEQISLFLSIDSELKRLNENILNLEQMIATNKNTEFYDAVVKIDAARASVEKLFSAENIQQITESSNNILQILSMLQLVLEKQEKNDRQLAQSLRDNANFQIQVRQGMQHDLDKLKEQMNGEQFNPILKEIASIYVEYQSLLDDETISERSRKNLQSLFEQIKDMLSDYGAEVCRSEIGSIRQTRTCKIIGKIPTEIKEKHNTIAISRKPGVVRERFVLYPEFVDVYVFDPTLVENTTSTTEAITENTNPVTSESVCGETMDELLDGTDTNNLGGNE